MCLPVRVHGCVHVICNAFVCSFSSVCVCVRARSGVWGWGVYCVVLCPCDFLLSLVPVHVFLASTFVTRDMLMGDFRAMETTGLCSGTDRAEEDKYEQRQRKKNAEKLTVLEKLTKRMEKLSKGGDACRHGMSLSIF